VIDMGDCLSIKEIHDHPKHSHLFVIYTKSRNYYLAAASKVDLPCPSLCTLRCAGRHDDVGAHAWPAHHL
jgi:hypothetical protein